MKWITRENIKVDRVACPWLIRRFADPQAQFLFVSESQLLETATRENAIPFDAPGLPEVKLNHRGVRCSFEERLALILRSADIKGQEPIAVEGISSLILNPEFLGAEVLEETWRTLVQAAERDLGGAFGHSFSLRVK
jgi:hypothetical protein